MRRHTLAPFGHVMHALILASTSPAKKVVSRRMLKDQLGKARAANDEAVP